LRCHLQRLTQWLAACGVAAGSLFPLHASAAAPAPRFDISRYVVQGNTLLPAAELEALLAPYRGPRRGFADVEHAVEALRKAYARHGFALVRVSLPEQELDRGEVRLQVSEVRIGRVSVEGNRFFDTPDIRRSLPELREGHTPDMMRLSASLAQANENPAKKATLELQGGERDEVDARVKVVDEKPWTVALNIDNTGTEATGKTLVGAVYQNANASGHDDVLSLQYTTTAEKPRSVSLYGAGYHIPIYTLGDSLDFYANYSDVDSGTILAGIFDLQVSGKGTVAGARYNHAFGRLGGLDSALSVGFDHKAYRTGVGFQGFELGSDVTVHPVSVAYAGTWKVGAASSAFTLSVAHNLAGGANGGADDFARARSDARAAYTLARLGLAHTRELAGDWQLRAAAAGQYTRDALIPGEQFGVGGMGSVRGFASREVAGDSGVSGSAEAYTPDLCARLTGTFCRVLAFYDVAHVTRNHALPGEFTAASIASAGLGLRAAVGRHATLQLDYGHVLDAGLTEARGHSRLDFRLSLTY
jgi:hemolysin activation/secretion protein